MLTCWITILTSSPPSPPYPPLPPSPSHPPPSSLLPLLNTSLRFPPFLLPPFFISQAIPRSLTHYSTVPLPSSSHPPLTDSITVPEGVERGEGSNSSAPLLFGSLTTSPQNETLIGKVRIVPYSRCQVVYYTHMFTYCSEVQSIDGTVEPCLMDTEYI